MPKLMQAFFGDTAEVASNMMPPTVLFFNEDVQTYEYDPERSRQLLA